MTATFRVGNAPVSWGVYEAGKPSSPPFATVLDAIAAAGYEGTELGPYGYYPSDAAALDRELKGRKLALASSFVNLPLADPGKRQEMVAKVLKVGSLLASQKVREVIIADDETEERRKIAGRVPGDGSAGWNEKDWKEVLATLQAIAAAVREKHSMRVVVHHHAGTHLETPNEIDRLLRSTDADQVGLLLDTGHLIFGGGDPRQLLTQYGARVRYVHYKDVNAAIMAQVYGLSLHMNDAWKQGVFCALGEGLVEFPKITDKLRSLNYSGWIVVEQDVIPDASGKLEPEPTDSARKSRRYLKDNCGL